MEYDTRKKALDIQVICREGKHQTYYEETEAIVACLKEKIEGEDNSLCSEVKMTEKEFRVLLDLFMITSDSWPLTEECHATMHSWIDREARQWGFMNWVAAYHGIDR